MIFPMLEHENVFKRTAVYRKCISTMLLMMMFMVYHWSMVNWRRDHVGHVNRMVKGLMVQGCRMMGCLMVNCRVGLVVKRGWMVKRLMVHRRGMIMH